MAENATVKINISVRDLVEFILRAGDIDNREAHGDMAAMQEGSRLHRKLQKAAGEDYRAEVSLKIEAPSEYEGESFLLCVEGRADGVFTADGPETEPALTTKREAAALAAPLTYIDEIKTTLRNVGRMTEPVPVHRSQAMCYAYIYAQQYGLEAIGIRMTYCNQDNEEIKYFPEIFAFAELQAWFERLIKEYSKWAAWQLKWVRARNASIAEGRFPFEYRAGQRELVGNVYRTIKQGKRLFIEAPTGVGKTISTVFPAVWAMGEGRAEKIFYGTAKTIARTVAEEAFGNLIRGGMKLKCVTITSKEKICVLEKPECNPVACERACGHFDRVNDAVYDLLTHEEHIDRPLIEAYAAKHKVCPFEMCLDVTSWSDVIICDYNYIFDPTAHLRRFFDTPGTPRYCFLIDEAHNLVERAREMYSAEFIKEDFLAAKAALRGGKAAPGDRKEESAMAAESGVTGAAQLPQKAFEGEQAAVTGPDGAAQLTPEAFESEQAAGNGQPVVSTRKKWKLEAAKDRIAVTLDACNRALLTFKRECDEFDVWEDCEHFVTALTRFAGVYEDLSRDLHGEENEKVLELYFNARHFLDMYESMDGDYTIFTDYTPDRHFRLRLQCMEPQRPLENYLSQAVSSIFFSATLLPIRYYMEQLGGRKEDYAVYAPSPFDPGRRLLMVGSDVSTKYTRRNDGEYAKIADYIESFTQARTGNYMVFFPSYKLMEAVAGALEGRLEGIVQQGRSMREEEKEEFLNSFTENPTASRIGFCVMGGIFAEGIDLKSDRLIGVVVVGTGLPMVCNERELFRGYFDEKNHCGFEYAYLYNGMNKVMQAAGRVIRTTEDTGAILLLDERFLTRQYMELFPREWADFYTVNVNNVRKTIEEFWSSH